MAGFELGGRDEPEEGVAASEAVVEEPEWSFAVHGDKPEGKFRHLDGERVDVYAVEAAFRDLPARFEKYRLCFAVGAGLPAGTGGDRPCRFGPSLLVPCFEEPLGEVAACGDEESAGSHCYIGDAKSEDVR